VTILPGDPILDWLLDCAQNDRPVRLINAYRGIPIAYFTRAIAVNVGNAIFAVNEYQAVCLALDGKTHIQRPGTPDALRARVISVDVTKKEVILTEFTRAAGPLGKRMTTRVQPSSPIDAEMRLGNHLFPCQLVDISLNGVGVITLETYTYGDLEVGKGSKIQLYFTLPPMHMPVQLAGQVTGVIEVQDSHQRRLGCKTFPESNVDLLLLEYVALRRDELMRELSLIYTAMRRERFNPISI
jgi:hypothetical protein